MNSVCNDLAETICRVVIRKHDDGFGTSNWLKVFCQGLTLKMVSPNYSLHLIFSYHHSLFYILCGVTFWTQQAYRSILFLLLTMFHLNTVFGFYNLKYFTTLGCEF